MADPANPRRAEQLRRLGQWHDAWSASHEADAASRFAPRHEGSDYNLHVDDMEASPAAEQEFHARALEILGLEGGADGHQS